jgi:serine/threonine protein kinase
VLRCGTRIAHYRIERELGHGGMGRVYAAFDERLERRVALKFLTADLSLDRSARARMLREARAASALNHPGIVVVYEVGETADGTYIAMELIDGETLAELLARTGPLPPRDAVALVRQVGDAVAVAHDAGILHRDLKTANLMIDARGRVKVLDFGLSKRIGPDESEAPAAATRGVPTNTNDIDTVREGVAETASPGPVAVVARAADGLTRPGQRMGTPGRAALELMRGEPADRRSDVFALGVLLYELCTAARPFPQLVWDELVDALEREACTPASQLTPAVGAVLDEVIRRALRARREGRFDSVGEFVAAMEAAVTPRRGARWPIVLVAGIVVAGGATAWIAARRSADSSPPPASRPNPPLPGRPAGAARPLTSLGGCAYAPAFVDDATMVFDLNRGADDHVWRVPVAGGAPQQITSGSLTEWRASAGAKPGQMIYVVADPSRSAGTQAGVVASDLAGQHRDRLVSTTVRSAAYAGGTLYYVNRDGSELRRLRDGVDAVAVRFEGGVSAGQIAAAHDGTRIALVDNFGTPRICVASLADAKVECLPSKRASVGRPAFGSDDTAIYYGGMLGISRLRSGADERVVPGANVTGGLAISPDGGHLVYSDCLGLGPLSVVSEVPPRALAPSGFYGELGVGPDGSIVYSTTRAEGYVLMRRSPGGTVQQLDGPSDEKFLQPRLSRDGRSLAFIAGHGIRVLRLDKDALLPSFAVTDDPEDVDPVWLPDGRLAFTRGSDPAGVRILDPDGGSPEPLEPVARRIVGVLEGGDLLLLSIDATQFVEWDVKAKRERRSTVTLRAEHRLSGLAMSPNGRWLVTMAGFGQLAYLHDLRDPKAEPRLVFQPAVDQVVSGYIVDDDGHVIAAPSTRTGELYVIDAAPGTRF